MFRWKGKRLVINLNTRQIVKENISEQEFRKYLGGRGFNIAILHERLPIGTKPLEPENILCFGTGLCLLYTSPSPRDATLSRMPSSA